MSAAPPSASAPHVLFVGRTTLDALYWLDTFPEQDTKVYAQAMRVAPGGPACNAAITCRLLGGPATLISTLGGGVWAGVVRAELARAGVQILDLADSACELPLTTVLIHRTNATRTIVNPPLTAPSLRTIDHWDEQWGPVPQVVLTDGFHLEELLPFLKSCREAGAALCLDGGSWKPGTAELAPLLTAAICGERFALPHEAPDPERTLAWFRAQGVPQVAVTRGSRPILALEGERRFEVAIEPIDAQDTLGAGDVLHGAFCHEAARGINFESSLRRAAAVATQSCKGLGIRQECATVVSTARPIP